MKLNVFVVVLGLMLLSVSSLRAEDSATSQGLSGAMVDSANAVVSEGSSMSADAEKLMPDAMMPASQNAEAVMNEAKESAEDVAQTVSETAADAKSVVVLNKVCPISGEKIGEHGEPYLVEYNGKTYKLCCEMCKKDFLKDPEKYTKAAEEDAAKEATQ